MINCTFVSSNKNNKQLLICKICSLPHQGWNIELYPFNPLLTVPAVILLWCCAIFRPTTQNKSTQIVLKRVTRRMHIYSLLLYSVAWTQMTIQRMSSQGFYEMSQVRQWLSFFPHQTTQVFYFWTSLCLPVPVQWNVSTYNFIILWRCWESAF